MKKSLLALLCLVLWPSLAFAQPDATIKVGEIVQLQFNEPAEATKPPAGLTAVYRAQVDGTAIEAVSSPVAGSFSKRVFALPPFAAIGTHQLTVSAQWTATDPTKWTCDATLCPEVVSAPITVAIVGDTPPTLPAPDGLQIIRTVTVVETVIDKDGRILRSTTQSKTDIEPIER